MLHVPLFSIGTPARITPNRIVSQFLRRLVAMGIAALLLIAPLSLAPRSFSVRAQETSGSKPSGLNHFVLYQNSSGEVVCRAATPAEGSQLDNINPSSQGLQLINHLQSDRYAHRTSRARVTTISGTNLTINLRATAQLDSNTAAKNAFIRAAQNWETVILSPITIYLDVDFGATNFGQPWGASVLGSTSTPGNSYPYQTVRANMIAEANGEGNATKQAIFNALPSTTLPTDLGAASTTSVSASLARAIGLLPAVAQPSDSAGRIAFNSSFTYDFDPTDGITPGQTDFDAVATHEIGHALGFVSDAGTSSVTPRDAVWDLYRFRTGTTSGTFTTAQRVVTIGGSPDPLQFDFIPGNAELGLSTGGPSGVSTNGGDGRQSSHWKHVAACLGAIGIMDPAISSGCRRTISASDQLALTSFGYNLTNNNAPPPPPPPPPPPANDNFANAQVLSGCSGSVNGTNIGATREAGEPDGVFPESPTTKTSVWYQWQAPSTGNVTIDTIGSDFDTVLAVYTGTSVSTLGTAIAHNDDNDPPNTPEHEVTSLVTFSATQGTIYRIAVGGFDNGGSGGDTGSIKLNWTEANCVQAPTIQFSSSNYSVGEGAGQATITVTRSGDTTGSATVDYRTADTDTFTVGCADTVNNLGSAYARCDFATVVGTLSFAAGEASKTFTVPIIDDSYAEGNETFSVVLSNPTGSPLGSPSTATVTIIDNDAVNGPNPMLATNSAGVTFFVRQHYLDFLGREPEVGEPWSPILNGCANQFNTDPNSPSAGCDRITVSGAFFGSPEFKDKGIYVIDFYRVAFNRLPLYSEFAQDLASVTGATAGETNAKRAAFATNFVLRNEFVNGPPTAYGAMSNSTYVTTLMGRYSLTSITTPDPANPDGAAKVTLTTTDLTNRLSGIGGTMTRAQVLRAIVQSDQVSLNFEAVNAFVASQYYGYLRRTPDTGGFNGWVTYLKNNPNDFRTMVNGFVNSLEYRLRFGPQ